MRLAWRIYAAITSGILRRNPVQRSWLEYVRRFEEIRQEKLFLISTRGSIDFVTILIFLVESTEILFIANCSLFSLKDLSYPESVFCVPEIMKIRWVILSISSTIASFGELFKFRAQDLERDCWSDVRDHRETASRIISDNSRKFCISNYLLDQQ